MKLNELRRPDELKLHAGNGGQGRRVLRLDAVKLERQRRLFAERDGVAVQRRGKARRAPAGD